MMARSVIILMAEMKLIPAGCGLFAVLDTRKNRTWWYFNIMAVSITGQSERFYLGRSC